VKGSKISNSRLVSSEDFSLWMTGQENGTGIFIPGKTILNFPTSIADISISSILPNEKMLKAL